MHDPRRLDADAAPHAHDDAPPHHHHHHAGGSEVGAEDHVHPSGARTPREDRPVARVERVGWPGAGERVAILDAYSGIAGDMTLGALVACGLDPDWLRALPATLGLEGIGVHVRHVDRAGIACVQVTFDIPPQPHGRHLAEIRRLVAAAGAVPPAVRERADRVFTLIAEQEAEIHGTTVDRVHLHEVGAVDAILDVVGSVWGLQLLGVREVRCGAVRVGDGYVRAAHGVMPVPAPATLRILEGVRVRPGPRGAGELVTPTGAALVRVLSEGPPPDEFIPVRSGFGAGTKEFGDRANALRLVLAEVAAREEREALVVLAADVDDLSAEYVAAAAEALRAAGALDVVLLPTVMKKGRPGTRLEVLARPTDADALEQALFAHTTTIGVRRLLVARRALARATRTVHVDGAPVRVKVTTLPDGTVRAKPELDDVRAAAARLGRATLDVADAARHASRSGATSGDEA